MTIKTVGYGLLVGVMAIGLAIGTATTGEAKSKAKAVSAGPTTGICTLQARAPVCATRGKSKFTYANACFASQDGAKIVKAGACPTPKAGKKGGKKKKKK